MISGAAASKKLEARVHDQFSHTANLPALSAGRPSLQFLGFRGGGRLFVCLAVLLAVIHQE